jgi:hypothetical protein
VDPAIVLESITLESNGSVTKTTPNQDGRLRVVGTGHNVIILFPDDIPAGPSTTLFIGRVEFLLHPETFHTEIVGSSGQRIDVCAMIAP